MTVISKKVEDEIPTEGIRWAAFPNQVSGPRSITSPLKEGDEIEESDYLSMKVLGVCGGICHLSKYTDHEAFGKTMSQAEMIKAKFTLQTK